MQSVTSFPASAVSSDLLARILADYTALDRVRTFRRVLVVRFGLVTIVVAVGGLVLPRLSPFERWAPIALCLLPPLVVRAMEFRLAHRLSRHLDGVEGVVIQSGLSGFSDANSHADTRLAAGPRVDPVKKS
jgi:hypothetical protein